MSRFIIISGLALTFSLTSFAAVIQPAQRATVIQPFHTNTTTTTTVITHQPVGLSQQRTIIRQNTMERRPYRTPNPLTPMGTRPVIPNTIIQTPPTPIR